MGQLITWQAIATHGERDGGERSAVAGEPGRRTAEGTGVFQHGAGQTNCLRLDCTAIVWVQ